MDNSKVVIHVDNIKIGPSDVSGEIDNDIREIKTKSLYTKIINFMNMDFVEAIVKYYLYIISITLIQSTLQYY